MGYNILSVHVTFNNVYWSYKQNNVFFCPPYSDIYLLISFGSGGKWWIIMWAVCVV